jgi:hypothetical protein
MKLCHFEYKNETHWGAVRGDSIFPLDNIEELPQAVDAVTLTDYIKSEDVRFLAPAYIFESSIINYH